MRFAKHDPFALRRAVQTALECPDDAWYRYTLQKDLCGCPLSGDETRAVIDGAVQTATGLVEQITAQYDLLSPAGLAKALGLQLARTAAALQEPYLYLGLYEPDTRTITLNDSALLIVRQFIVANGLNDLTPADDITRIALLHEIFHALEDATPEIYTRSRMLKRKLLGVFPYRRGLGSLSEVGAVHFSKCLAQVAYSPCIFERYLLLALDQLSIDFFTPNV